ncbi:unnamed protein product [Ixodes hexagonus]
MSCQLVTCNSVLIARFFTKKQYSYLKRSPTSFLAVIIFGKKVGGLSEFTVVFESFDSKLFGEYHYFFLVFLYMFLRSRVAHRSAIFCSKATKVMRKSHSSHAERRACRTRSAICREAREP